MITTYTALFACYRRLTNSRRMRFKGNVERKDELRNARKILVRNLTGTENLEDLYISQYWRKILKCKLDKWCEGRDCTQLGRNRA